MTKINESKNLEKIDIAKQDKAKKLMEDIMKQLKDLVQSSGNVGEVKAKIDMLKELDVNLASQVEKLLDQVENQVDKVAMSEPERLQKILDMIGGLMNGSIDIASMTGDNMSMMEDKGYDQFKIPGEEESGSISVNV